MARGFAGMDPARQREIAGQGGRAAQAKGTAHRFTPEQAARAGKKGGLSVKARYGIEHFRKMGHVGGSALAAKVGTEGMAALGKARHGKEEP